MKRLSSQLASSTSGSAELRRCLRCFSRPICKLAMRLNDYAATDAERQRLLPYVTRLACADTPEVEAKRAAFIKSQNRPLGRSIAA